MRSRAVWGLSGCRAQTRAPHRAGTLGLLEEQEGWGPPGLPVTRHPLWDTVE